jgi:hypothetical protein
MKFRKKPVVIEAMQMPVEKGASEVRKVAGWMIDQGYEEGPGSEAFDELDIEDVDAIYLYEGRFLPEYGTNFLDIETLEGTMTASLGDWIIKGVAGEFYPCKPDIFALTYELVNE